MSIQRQEIMRMNKLTPRHLLSGNICRSEYIFKVIRCIIAVFHHRLYELTASTMPSGIDTDEAMLILTGSLPHQKPHPK